MLLFTECIHCVPTEQIEEGKNTHLLIICEQTVLEVDVSLSATEKHIIIANSTFPLM